MGLLMLEIRHPAGVVGFDEGADHIKQADERIFLLFADDAFQLFIKKAELVVFGIGLRHMDDAG